MGSDGPSALEYFIAAAVLGTAIGNMFVVRRLRSISKLKSPGDPWEKIKHAANSNNPRNEQQAQQEVYDNLKKFQSKQNEIMMRKKVLNQWCNSNYDSRHRPSFHYLPDYYVKHLEVLRLPLNQYPSKAEVKEAWHKYAMIVHPDRDRNDAQKEVNNIKFRDGNDKYKELLLFIEGQEKDIIVGD